MVWFYWTCGAVYITTFSSSVFRQINSSRLSLKTLDVETCVSRFRSKSLSLVFSGALALGLSLSGNILNFNVGATVDLDIPRSFWSRLAGKYGSMFYWKEKGEDASIEAAVMAISSCLREPVGPNNCAEIK